MDTGEPDVPEVECRQIAELLADYLDGTLPKRLRELIDWHIESCGPCVAFVNTYRGTVDIAVNLGKIEVPPDLNRRLIDVLRSARKSTPPNLA